MKTLKYKANKLNIDLTLRGTKTLLQGDTATGKTYVYSMLKRVQPKENLYFIDYNSTIGGENVKSMIEYISKKKDLCVIIDQADELFEIYPELQEMVADDYYNYYLIIGRNPDVMISPSNLADLKIENNLATLKYRFPEPYTGR